MGEGDRSEYILVTFGGRVSETIGIKKGARVIKVCSRLSFLPCLAVCLFAVLPTERSGSRGSAEGSWARRGGRSRADYKSRARWVFSGSLASCPSRGTARLASGTLVRRGSGGDSRPAPSRLEPQGRSSAWGCGAQSSVLL